MILTLDHYLGAFIFIVFSAIFDFLDGLSARLLKTYSETGKELDSLADVISFGLAPGCIVYTYLESLLYCTGWVYIPFIAFLLPVFSALRLAKFNIDTRQSSSFLGLPVPASALFWASLIPSFHYYFHIQPLLVLILIIFLLLVFGFLMISEIPMFSLKFKNLEWKANKWSFYLIILSIVLFGVFFYWEMPLLGINLIVIAYIILSLIKNTIK
jgi:CDP-diacylglycerol--serine O-phosphatidyltransferase